MCVCVGGGGCCFSRLLGSSSRSSSSSSSSSFFFFFLTGGAGRVGGHRRLSIKSILEFRFVQFMAKNKKWKIA